MITLSPTKKEADHPLLLVEEHVFFQGIPRALPLLDWLGHPCDRILLMDIGQNHAPVPVPAVLDIDYSEACGFHLCLFRGQAMAKPSLQSMACAPTL